MNRYLVGSTYGRGILVSPCPSVCRQILCRTITWVVFLRIFYQLFTGEERRIPFFFDDFHFCRSRVIGLDMTENRIFTLCRMIAWVVFLRMFWNFISSLPVKRGGSLSFLVRTISNVLVMEIGWTDVGSGGYILVSTSFNLICSNDRNLWSLLITRTKVIWHVSNRHHILSRQYQCLHWLRNDLSWLNKLKINDPRIGIISIYIAFVFYIRYV